MEFFRLLDTARPGGRGPTVAKSLKQDVFPAWMKTRRHLLERLREHGDLNERQFYELYRCSPTKDPQLYRLLERCHLDGCRWVERGFSETLYRWAKDRSVTIQASILDRLITFIPETGPVLRIVLADTEDGGFKVVPEPWNVKLEAWQPSEPKGKWRKRMIEVLKAAMDEHVEERRQILHGREIIHDPGNPKRAVFAVILFQVEERSETEIARLFEISKPRVSQLLAAEAELLDLDLRPPHPGGRPEL